MPAAFTWLGSTASPSYDDASNWSGPPGQVPGNGDDLTFAPVLRTPPGSSTVFGDDDPPPSPTWASGDCVIPRPYHFAGVHLTAGFTGTVTFQAAATIDDFELFNGAVKQAGSGAELSITHVMNFLGGTLNSGTAPSTVHIAGQNGTGASANLQPVFTPALTIGSTISLEGLGTAATGAGMAIFVGDYAIKNGADFKVGESSYMQVGLTVPVIPVAPYVTSKVNFTTVEQPNGGKPYSEFQIAKKGFCTFVRSFEGSVRVIDDGTMTVKTGAVVKLTDPMDANVPTVLVGKTGTLNLENDSTLSVTNAIYVEGILNTVYVAGAAKQTVFIEGKLAVDKVGSVLIADAAPANKFNGLHVTGDFALDGTLKMHVNGAGAGTDLVDITGTFLVQENHKLDVTYKNKATAPAKGTFWLVIEANTVSNIPFPVDGVNYDTAVDFDKGRVTVTYIK